MKTLVSSIIVSISVLATTLGTASAATLYFDDNFDGSQYGNNAPLVYGPGTLPHGIWSVNNAGTGETITSTAQALSPTRSLALTTTTGTGNNAQAIGLFSADGVNRSRPTEAISLRLAFRTSIYDGSPDNELYIDSTNGGHSAYVTFGANGRVTAWSHNQTTVVTDSLQSDTWYYLELVMPNLPGTQYTTNVYEMDGTTLIGSATTALRSLTADDYHFFTVYHGADNFTTYIDNVTATAVPEPATAALGILLLGGYLGARKTLSSLRASRN